MTIIHRDDVEPLVNERGEIIRELASPRLSGLSHHSVAESIIPPGASTIPHHHRTSKGFALSAQRFIAGWPSASNQQSAERTMT